MSKPTIPGGFSSLVNADLKRLLATETTMARVTQDMIEDSVRTGEYSIFPHRIRTHDDHGIPLYPGRVLGPDDYIEDETFADYYKTIKVREFGLSIPYTGDLFTDSARPGETRLDCKRRMHMEQQTMANDQWYVSTGKSAKLLVPRTKREKALVEQTQHQAWHEGHSKGFDNGNTNGAEKERQRGEAFLLKAIAAATAGKAAF